MNIGSRRRCGEEIQKRLSNRINCKPLGSNVVLGTGDFIRAWHFPTLDRHRLISLTFVEQEEEGLVLDNRPADIRVKLIIVNGSGFALPRACAVVSVMLGEVIRGISKPAVVNPICTTVPGVCTALHVKENRRSPLYPKF